MFFFVFGEEYIESHILTPKAKIFPRKKSWRHFSKNVQLVVCWRHSNRRTIINRCTIASPPGQGKKQDEVLSFYCCTELCKKSANTTVSLNEP